MSNFALRGATGSTDLYAITSTNLAHRSFTSPTWGVWSNESLTVGGTTTIAGGVSAVLVPGGSTEHMLVLGSDSQVWWRQRSLPGTWGAWSSTLAGVLPLRPAISATSNGNVQAWAFGTNYVLFWKRYTTSWTGSWASIAMPANVTPQTAPAAFARGGTNTVFLSFFGYNSVSGTYRFYTATWDDTTQTASAWTDQGYPAGSSYSPAGPALSTRYVSSGLASWIVELWAAGSDGHLYVKTYTVSGGWGTWSDSPSRSGGALTVPGAQCAAGALGDSTGNVHVVTGAPTNGDGSVDPWWRFYQYTTPAAEVMMSPDVVMQGKLSLNDAGIGCNSYAGGPVWESSVLAVPPNKAGCGADGGVIFAPSTAWNFGAGYEYPVFRGDIGCFQGDGGFLDDAGALTCVGSASKECAASSTNIFTTALDGGWPSTLVPSGGGPPGGSFGAADDLIARVGSLDAGVPNILKLKADKIASSPNATSSGLGYRGAAMGFVTGDCDKTWALTGVIDPCDPQYADTFAGRMDTYACPAAGNGPGCSYCGLDRPEIFVSPTDPKKIWFTAQTFGLRYLFSSTNGGASWPGSTFIVSSFYSQPTAVGDRLFFFYVGASSSLSCVGGNSPSMKMFDGATVSDVAGSGISCTGTSCNISTDCEGFEDASSFTKSWISATPIGQFGNHYFIRGAMPMMNGNKQFHRVRIYDVVVSGGQATATSVGSFDVSSTTGSALQLEATIPTTHDYAPGSQSSLAFYTWFDSDNPEAPGGGGYGNMRVKGCVVRDLDATCTPLVLSLDASGATRSPPAFGGIPPLAPWAGDYRRGSFFYDPSDPAGKTHKFMAQWIESRAGDANLQAVHMNIVRVAP